MHEFYLSKHHCMLTIADGSLSERNTFLETLLRSVSENYSGVAWITDTKVHGLYFNLIKKFLEETGLAYCLITLPPGETSKTLLGAHRCWTDMLAAGLDRQSLAIAFGGGAITDIAGFSASCFMRGIDLIHIPTTLLGMVDAAIGGKTGVNLSEGKNLIGSFHYPKQIFISPSFLQTLPKREFRSGLAEVIKYGVIRDPIFFSYLEQHLPAILQKTPENLLTIVHKSCEIKMQVVNEDPEDKAGVRAILNWGHTFAHALEKIARYKTYLHGEAVAIGMCLAAQLSEHLGFAHPEFSIRQKELIQRAGLPTRPHPVCLDQLIQAMKCDKKSTFGKIRLILAENIGKSLGIKEVHPKCIREALLKGV